MHHIISGLQQLKEMSSELSKENIETMIKYIKSTYLGVTTEEIKLSQNQMLNVFNTFPSTLDVVYGFMRADSTMDDNFKLACANLIKTHYYKIARKNIEKTIFIFNAYTFVLDPLQNKKIKELLAISIEHIINEDHESIYKGKLIEDLFKQIEHLQFEEWNAQTLEKVWGLATIAITCLNSLVQIEQICEFVLAILNKITALASLCLFFIEKKVTEDGGSLHIFQGPKKIFEFLEISIERIVDEEQFVEQQCNQILQSDNLRNVILSYLHLYNNGGSIITPYYPLNELKEKIMEILHTIYRRRQLSRELFQMILVSFLNECSSQQRQSQQESFSEQILCRCMQIIEYHLKNKFHYELILQFKIEILFAIFVYTKTQQTEEEYMEDHPEKFVELAEDYTEGNGMSLHLKVRAGCLLKVFVAHVDDGRKMAAEFAIIFLTGSINPMEEDEPEMKLVKEEFAKYEFMSLNKRNKIDISFLVLSCISHEIKGDQSSSKMLISLFLTYQNFFTSLDDNLLLLRFIRCVGYFPSSLFFAPIKNMMERGRVFVIEGLLAFNRIAKDESYLTSFPIIQKVFEDLVIFLEVGDVVFEEIIQTHYESILHKNKKIFAKVANKIRQTYTYETENKQKSLTCLKHLEQLISKEKNPEYEAFLQENVKSMYNVGKDIELHEESFISIFLSILNKRMFISSLVEEFVYTAIRKEKLHTTFSSSKLFIFANKFVLKTESDRAIEHIYSEFFGYLMTHDEKSFNVSIVPMICFIMGQIVITNVSFSFNAQNMEVILAAFSKSQGQPQIWLSCLVLQYIFRFTRVLKQYLIKTNQYYPVLLRIFKIRYVSLIQRKIVVRAMTELIRTELEPQILKETIRFCCQILHTQYEVYKQKPHFIPKNEKPQTKLRRMLAFEEKKKKPSQSEEERDPKSIQDTQSFKSYRHSFIQQCEFTIFKTAIQSINGIKSIMEPLDLERLKEIMFVEWYKNNTRKIIRVHRNM